VNVSVPPELTDRPLLPDARLTVTVTFDVGAVDSDNPNVPDPPWATDSDVGLATMLGLVAGLTVTDTAEDVALAPLESNASAVSEYVPAATPVQLNVYGLVVEVPSSVVPLKNSTLLIVAPLSLAVAASGIVAGAV